MQLFYDQREDVKDKKPLGFGWMHDLKFCYAPFQFVNKKNEITNEEELHVKTLTQEELNIVNYIKRDKEKLEFDNPSLKPVSFIIT